jgi:hypothetical protein
MGSRPGGIRQPWLICRRHLSTEGDVEAAGSQHLAKDCKTRECNSFDEECKSHAKRGQRVARSMFEQRCGSSEIAQAGRPHEVRRTAGIW